MKDLSWKTDVYGRPEYALYYSRLYVGSLLFHEDQKFHIGKPWRGWFHCHDDDGADTGWHATKEEAQASVEAAFRAAISEGVPCPTAQNRLKLIT